LAKERRLCFSVSELQQLERRAIEVLRAFEPDDGYYLCYSGGKDSDVIRILADLANVKHETHHNLTTADAPETVQYVKSVPGVIIDRPELSMWRLIEKKQFPPTRLQRYCCEALKERGGKGKLKITGVRKAESNSRKKNRGLVNVSGKPKRTQKQADLLGVDYETPHKKGLVLNMDNDPARRLVEQCYRTTTTMVNPIIDWTDDEVWEFLNAYGCQSNPLYECGLKRIGCIGCPMGGRKAQNKEFARWPKYRSMYVHAFDRMLEARRNAGKESKLNWTDGESVMRWWLQEKDA